MKKQEDIEWAKRMKALNPPTPGKLIITAGQKSNQLSGYSGKITAKGGDRTPSSITSHEYMRIDDIFTKYDFTGADKKALIKFRDMVWYGRYAENEKGERVNPITLEKEDLNANPK